MVAAKTVAEHAAARAARARAVGFNRFMCEKTARAALIPAAGRRLWPQDQAADEASRVPIYMAAEDPARANGVLEYEGWHSADLDLDSGSSVEATVKLDAGDFKVSATAGVEAHSPLYMQDLGM